MSSARGGTRTHTPLRTTDFESVASAIPPLGRVTGRAYLRRARRSISVTPTNPVRGLLWRDHACLHVPRPGLAASWDGAPVGRPRELGAGRRSVGGGRARHRRAAA